MNKPVSSRRRWVMTAAVAAAAVPLLAFSSVSSAQQRINTNGRALDANNRVGSGGYNPGDAGARAPQNAVGNAIVTGNVTAGRHFRGAVDYTDPGAFRAPTAGINMDNFLRQASGPTQDSRLAETETRFYGQSRAAPPPPNFIESGIGSGAYVPLTGTTINRPLSDQRVGAVNFSQPYVLPAPGQLLMPGPVDPSAGQQYISASPLTGIRQINANDPSFFTNVTNTQYNPTSGQLDANAIQRMRDELNAAANVGNPAARPSTENRDLTDPSLVPGSDDATGEGGAGGAGGANRPGGPIQQQPIQLPGAGTGAQPVAQRPMNTQIAQGPNNLDTGQSVRNRMTELVRPEDQSTIYAQLRRRHDEAVADRTMTDAEAARAYNTARRAAEEQAKRSGAMANVPPAPGAGQPGDALPGSAAPGDRAPGVAPVPQPPGPGDAPAPGIVDYSARNEKLLKEGVDAEKRRKKVYTPVKVPSLATGVKGKGLADILKSAETLMKEGKFTSALDKYDAAEQVAPNNPLTRLGRANAELGASYYARAEAHLRDVFQKNPELLAGQYDLTSMLGEQRLAVLVKDLKDIANREQNEARPVFLLAYIAYNTGHEQNAEAYLDLADKRSGGKDPFFKLLRENWALPAGGAPTAAPAPAPEQNK